MDNGDNDKPDPEAPLPFAALTPDGILVGVLPETLAPGDFCEKMTGGAYRDAGDIASIAVFPRAIDDKQAGLLIGMQFPDPDNEGGVQRVEIGRITYQAFVHCLVAVVRGMQELDLLKYEPQGDMLQALLEAEQKRQQNLQ